MAFKRKYGITDTTGATGTNGGTSDSNGDGMGTMDWVGLGMQVAGALANSQEEQKAKELEQLRYDQQREQSLKTSQLNRQDTLQQNAVENQQRNRTQNQAGLSYMTGLINDNEAAGRKRSPSFRQTMLYGSN
jgi:hypothetical protein